MRYYSNIHHRRSIRLKGYDYSQAGLYFITICVQDRKCLFGKIAGESPAGAQMELNELGSVAYDQWQKLPERFMNMELDVFQIMPNHMHGIILLTEFVGAGFTPAQNDTNTPAQNDTNTPAQNDTNTPAQNNTNTPAQNNTNTPAQNDTNTPAQNDAVAQNDNPVSDDTRAEASPAPTKSKSIGDIVGAYKSLVANECLKIFKQKYPDEMMGKLWQRNYYEHIIRDEQSYKRISDYIIKNPAKWKDDKFYND